ncbi:MULTISPECIES: PadR family transcriptional regulator [Thermomonospora]|uniref:Transcriptional regulator, PadR-like family n=1 Tax=Thermomonospora curvata (strain ATCC 19995 / DSM 43183 / JCM 3096 / KCTC 9072 / NBRC 15933 / NCIMB 10081 / Henssen B9) TaxID=471852 RepID=D1A5B6_THECD|nr:MULTISPECIES: helix-turn-helix transcriptional regulator [Thermomonospora]ACZ00102.1 transcriptional regulator, PadR-like family [Thermomonospora curvata DSM 43183]PKK11929.1 MAG: PadR family transcriptional regulator [Thermomonospora sp. CIF 1]
MEGSEVRGLLRPFLLLLIFERPGHGYELIERLEGLGAEDVEPAHVYRVLRGLERKRLVASSWVPSDSGPARRRYELTPDGAAELESWMGRLARLGQVLERCLGRWGKVSQASLPAPLNGGPARSGGRSPVIVRP